MGNKIPWLFLFPDCIYMSIFVEETKNPKEL